jgi:hypothetical protein
MRKTHSIHFHAVGSLNKWFLSRRPLDHVVGDGHRVIRGRNKKKFITVTFTAELLSALREGVGRFA